MACEVAPWSDVEVFSVRAPVRLIVHAVPHSPVLRLRSYLLSGPLKLDSIRLHSMPLPTSTKSATFMTMMTPQIKIAKIVVIQPFFI